VRKHPVGPSQTGDKASIPEQEQSTAAPVDWTDDEIYRAVFLALFGPEERAALQRSGIIFAT
jgi:hypothetical protein